MLRTHLNLRQLQTPEFGLLLFMLFREFYLIHFIRFQKIRNILKSTYVYRRLYGSILTFFW
jgi:hypothetical protein